MSDLSKADLFMGNTNMEQGTACIAVIFIFIAYFLHPLVESAYHRVRAYRAWQAIERNECVEVTHLGMVDEVLRGRGKWDAARMIASLLLLFSIASWVLELGLGLSDVEDGPVDMLDRPPPVVRKESTEGNTPDPHWYLWADRDDFEPDEIPDEGSLGNFEYGLEEGFALSKYRKWLMDGDGNMTGVDDKGWDGQTTVASWYDTTVSPYGLHYENSSNRDDATTLSSLECEPSQEGFLYVSDTGKMVEWGNFSHCDQGPNMASDNENRESPPTIIMNHTSTGDVHLVVEEQGSYPGFVYSVWKVTEDNPNGPVTVRHVFHVASKFRLAEAIITGIAYGVTTGGGCVDLMMQYSWDNLDYAIDGYIRARPFGEHPGFNGVVDDLRKVEPIVKGINADWYASMSLALLVAMSLVGIGWSLSLRSSIEMDIYDRDELIRAVSLHDHGTGEKRTASMRMFVRKDAGGHIDVVVSDCGEDRPRYCPFFARSVVMAQDEPAVATSRADGGTNAIPTGPRQRRLEGMRLGLGRDTFPRGFGPRSSSITSSPLQSPASPADPISPAEYVDPAVAQATTLARGQMALRESSRFGSFSDRKAGPRPIPEAIAFATPSRPEARTVRLQATPSPARVSFTADDYFTPPRRIPVGNPRVHPTSSVRNFFSGSCPTEAISEDSVT